MQGLARSAGGLLRRPSVGFIFSALPRWRHRRDNPLVAAHPEGNLNCLRWFAYRSGLEKDKPSNHGCQTKDVKHSMTVEELQRAIMETGVNQVGSATEEVTESKATEDDTESNLSLKEVDTKSNPSPTKYIFSPTILRNSSHRDGAIYKKEPSPWKDDYYDVIADRNETRLEPMRFSVATNCNPDPENCDYHTPCSMVQIFSLKLATADIKSGPVLLYGYLAARDDLDSALNYVFHRTRDDPIIVQQGSPIEMIGPKRGILVNCDVLFEFDLRMKIGQQEDDDLQLVDGIIILYEMDILDRPMTIRINGNSSNVDMLLTNMCYGVEATVEVGISEVVNGFDFSLSSVISVPDIPEEFQLFDGHIGESCSLRRFVLAVNKDTVMHLKFKVDQKGSNVTEHCCSFEANLHGSASNKIKLDVASISVKVTWSPLIDEYV